MAEDCIVSGIPEVPQNGLEDERPYFFVQMRRHFSIPDVQVIKGCNIGEPELSPNTGYLCTAEEHAVSVFNASMATLAVVVSEDVLGTEVSPRTEPVFEVKPGENLDFVWNTRAPNTLPMHLGLAMAVIQCSIGVPDSECLAR